MSGCRAIPLSRREGERDAGAVKQGLGRRNVITYLLFVLAISVPDTADCFVSQEERSEE